MVANRKRRTVREHGPDTSSWSPEARQAHEHKQRLKTPVAEMKLSVRTINTLEEYGVILAEQLVKQTYASLMQIANFGEKTLKEVRAAVQALGLPVPDWKKPPRPKPVPKAQFPSLHEKR